MGVALISNTLFAQSQRELGQLMRERGEYYFTLNVEDLVGIENLGEICSVDGSDGRIVVAYANQVEYDKLIALGLRPTLQTPPSLREEAVMWEGGDRATYAWDSYLSYGDYVSMMESFPSSAAATGGRTCTLIDLGQLSTSAHRHLLGVRINNGNPEGKPKFLYTSTMHGDEVTGMILMLRLIDELCTSTDTRIVNLLNDVDIYIFPCTNPDGTYKGGNNTVTGAQRYNGHNIDLNRNYRDYFNGDHPDGNSYEDETTWTMALADENLFTMAANYHGGAEVMNYCWDRVFQDHADVDWWEYVCTEYVQIARQVYSSYMTDTYSDGVTNGTSWYSITGSRQDYMNGFAQCREVTVECSTNKTPNASQLPNFWNYNHNSMLALMEQARNGVHGIVYDANTNQPIQDVTVSVLNHDIHHSYVTTHEVGDFHRPIKGGSYTFIFDKEGYARKFVDVTVADDERVNLSVYLTPSNEIPMECYEQVDAGSIGGGPCLMGYRNGSTLIMPKHNDNSTSTNPVSVSNVSLSLTLTDDGFTLPYDSELQKIALNPSGSSGQYLITYKGRLLYRNNSSLTWAKPAKTSQTGTMNLSPYRWYVNAEGVYYLSGSTKYYLNYSNGSFTTSTTNQNNITFYRERNCLPMEYTVTATAYPEAGGTIEGVGTYLEGETCALTATANEDYQFVKWTENGTPVSTDATYSFEVTRNRALVAVFGSTLPMSITVSANPARGGSVSGGGAFLYGATCTVTATPNLNYNFTGWTEDGTLVSEDLEYSFMVTTGRTLVANFIYAATVSGNCYDAVVNTEITAGSYVMGYLNGSTLAVLSQDNSSVITTSETVTPTDNGFSMEEGTTLPQVTLAAYGNNGQYTILYNSKYLVRNSNSLTWSTSSNNGGWYINADGIYLTVSSYWGNSTSYFLYYNNGSFRLSQQQQNNITFYAEGDCPANAFNITATASPVEGGIIEGADLYYQGETCVLTATANEGYTFVNWTEGGEVVSTDAVYSFEVTGERGLVANFEEAVAQQAVNFVQGWNWWTPTVEVSLEDLETALGTNGIIIKTQTENVTYEDGEWLGDEITLVPGQMYKIQVSADCSFILSGSPVSNVSVTINYGSNWIGFTGSQVMSITEAFGDFIPAEGDVIKTATKNTTFEGGEWLGDFDTLQPGQGYIYISRDTEEKTLTL